MARYKGDGSYWQLFVDFYRTDKSSIDTEAYGNLERAPVSLIMAGVYSYYSGALSARGSSGEIWSSLILTQNVVKFTRFNLKYLNYDQNDWKGRSLSLRCAAKVINKNCL